MIKSIFLIFLSLIVLEASEHKMFQTVSMKEAQIVQNGKSKLYCSKCGMTLPMFYKTNHSAKVDSKATKQYCSIHCLAVEKSNHKLSDIKVVDTNTLKFIDAQKAYYVVGSKKRGTMSMVSKYAFSTEPEAKNFQSKFGGKVMKFDEALIEAQKGMPKDMAVLKKKKHKAAKVGKKIYNYMCDSNIEVVDTSSVSSIKSEIVSKNICPNIKGKKLQAVSIYLASKNHSHSSEIVVPKDAKCPVCGMFVAKYPKWVAKIVTNNNKSFYFDGVKDMMKYIFANPKLETKSIEVSNYYTTKGIDAKKAFYVVGSDVYGPMGLELIPFESMYEAKTFKKEHSGKQIYKFSDITVDIIKPLQ